MKNTLVISGHTDLSASVANKTILETIAQRLPQAEIVRLDSLYPDFKIDAQAEQQRLRQEYVKAFRAGLDGMLDGVFVAGQNGEAVPIKAYMKEKYGTKESK